MVLIAGGTVGDVTRGDNQDIVKLRKESKGIDDSLPTVRLLSLGAMTYSEIVWLSTKEAADRLGVTPRTLYRFIDQGELPGYRLGRVIRLKLTDIDEFIEASRIKPGELEHLYPDTSAHAESA